MSKFSISVDWINQDEYQQLLKNVTEAGQAFQKALDELKQYEATLNISGSVEKGNENEQTYQKET